MSTGTRFSFSRPEQSICCSQLNMGNKCKCVHRGKCDGEKSHFALLLDEAQAGIKIAGRSINSLRYADDTTLMAESRELKSLLMKVKEESEKFSLKLSIQKTKIVAYSSITSLQIDGDTLETVTDYFGGLQNHCRWRLQP